MTQTIKCLALSDIHGKFHQITKQLNNMPVRDVDLLILAGDIFECECPERDFTSATMNSLDEPIRAWCEMVQSIRPRNIILIPGNHDWFLHKTIHQFKAVDDLIKLFQGYLCYKPHIHISDNKRSIISVKGRDISIATYSYVTTIPNMTFPYMKDSDEQYTDLDSLKPDTDLLITHEAPYNTPIAELWDGTPIGCKPLQKIIETYKPKVLVCGHNHSGETFMHIGDTKCYNVSVLDLSYRPNVSRGRETGVYFELDTEA